MAGNFFPSFLAEEQLQLY